MKREKMKNLPIQSIVTNNQRDNSQQALDSERNRINDILSQKM